MEMGKKQKEIQISRKKPPEITAKDACCFNAIVHILKRWKFASETQSLQDLQNSVPKTDLSKICNILPSAFLTQQFFVWCHSILTSFLLPNFWIFGTPRIIVSLRSLKHSSTYVFDLLLQIQLKNELYEQKRKDEKGKKRDIPFVNPLLHT